MNKAPKIGQRVRYAGTHGHVGPCTGTVERIWEARECLVDDDDPRWDDPDFLPAYGGLKPESEWQVTVVVDEIPDPWPYRGAFGHGPSGVSRKFCPPVSEVEPL